MDEINKSIALNGTGEAIFRSAGIAYVSLPNINTQSRETFIENCYNTRTLFLRSENGDVWNRVHIDKSLISDIVFPPDEKTRGSAVLYVMVPKHNSPVVVAVLGLKDDLIEITKENFYQKTYNTNSGSVNVLMDSNIPSAGLNLVSTVSGEGELDLRIINPDDTAQANVFVRGDINIKATKNINLSSYQNIKINLLDNTGNIKSFFNYIVGQGSELKDEFGNDVVTNSNGVIITPSASGKVYVGGNDALSEPAVLGNTLNSNLTSLIDAIINLTTVLQTIGAADSTIASGLGLSYAAQLDSLLPNILENLTTISGNLVKQIASKSQVE